MSQVMLFCEIVEAADQLSMDEQEELISIMRRRLAERGRERVVEAVAQARREFAAGQCKVMTPAEIVREATSSDAPSCTVGRTL